MNGVIYAPPHKIYGSLAITWSCQATGPIPNSWKRTMPTIELKRIGDQLAPIDAKSMAILQKMPSDLMITTTGGWSLCKKRRRFFSALSKAAFEGWPRSHWFQPACPNHMYAYLLCRARHSTVQFIDRCELPLDFELGPENFAVLPNEGSRLGTIDDFAFLEAWEYDMIMIRRPASLAKRQCSEAAFANLVARALTEISAVLGVSTAELIHQAEEKSGVGVEGLVGH